MGDQRASEQEQAGRTLPPWDRRADSGDLRRALIDAFMAEEDDLDEPEPAYIIRHRGPSDRIELGAEGPERYDVYGPNTIPAIADYPDVEIAFVVFPGNVVHEVHDRGDPKERRRMGEIYGRMAAGAFVDDFAEELRAKFAAEEADA